MSLDLEAEEGAPAAIVLREPGATQATIWVGHVAFEHPGAETALEPGAGGQVITAPMPGAVISVAVADGDRVNAGDPVMVLEAMKMEHVLASPADGVIHLGVHPGTQVKLDEELARVAQPDDEEETS